MANATINDTTRLSATELRRRLTMPAGEAPPPPAVPEADLESLEGLRSALRPGNPSVSHMTPSPGEAIRPDILRDSKVFRKPAASPIEDMFPEARQAAGPADASQLHEENGELRELLNEMRQLLQEANEAEVRFKQELAQKNAQIADLQAHLDLFEKQVSAIEDRPKPKNADELEEWADELERENMKLQQLRRELDEERRQVRHDEADLEKQMRQMEVGMAKERAMMARQETELKRLNSEIQQELELMQRGDPALRDRLAMFQRRHQDVVARAGSAPSAPAAAPVQPQAQYIPEAQMAPGVKPTDSGMLRRIFRK